MNITEVVTRMDSWATKLGKDPIAALLSINFKAVGLVGATIILAVVIIDLIGYLFASYNGTSRSYVPYSRSAVDFLVDAWDNKKYNHIGEYYDPYARSRSLDTVTYAIDSLSSAWKKWGDEENEIPNVNREADHWQATNRLPAGGGFVFSS